MYTLIDQTVNWLGSHTKCKPKIAIILGSGLGNFANSINVINEFDYKEIPNFPVSTVTGHAGKLILGTIGNKEIMAMQGRFHYYEGYSMEEVTFPVRVMKALGIKTLLVSNAAGGINSEYSAGDLMIIKDHINMFPSSPLRGKNYDKFGPRFTDMSETYSKRIKDIALRISSNINLNIRLGVYVGVSGPTYETPAESKFFKIIGGDAVGMSTIPEVIVAHHAGIEIFGLSIITNCYKNTPTIVTHEEVQETAHAVEQNVQIFFTKLIENI